MAAVQQTIPGKVKNTILINLPGEQVGGKRNE